MADDRPVEKWRAYLAIAETLRISGRVVRMSVLRTINDAKVQKEIDKWVDHLFKIAKADLVAEGAERLQKDQPYIFMSNHQSLLDVPSVMKSAPGPVRAISKEELSKVPVFGQALGAGGVIFVDRKDREKAIRQLDAARPLLLEKKMSLWIAAEGTRSRDGRLYPFKKGGFHVAQQLGIPIVPTWISGTLDCLPPDTWAARPGGTVRVHYGEPIVTEGMPREGIPEVMAQTREVMLQLAKDAGDGDVDASGE